MNTNQLYTSFQPCEQIVDQPLVQVLQLSDQLFQPLVQVLMPCDQMFQTL